MLPVTVVRGSPSLKLRASARTWLRWLRPRAVPLAAAAAWLCAIVVGAQCSSRARRNEVGAAVVLTQSPVAPASTRALGPVDHRLAPEPDTCMPDQVLSLNPAHRRLSGKLCTFSLPPCGGHDSAGLAARTRMRSQRTCVLDYASSRRRFAGTRLSCSDTNECTHSLITDQCESV